MRTIRSLAGQKSKRNGQAFELLFQAHCERHGIAITRIPDGCRQIGANRIMRVKSPWDFVASFNGRTALLDTKTTGANSFPHSQIDENQVNAMLPHERLGAIAGYVIHTRENGQVFFIRASALNQCRRIRGGIEPTHPDAIRLGAIHDFSPRLLFAEGKAS